MVRHQDVGVNRAAVLFRQRLQCIQVPPIILGCIETGGAVVAALDDMPRNTGDRESRATGHDVVRLQRVAAPRSLSWTGAWPQRHFGAARRSHGLIGIVSSTSCWRVEPGGAWAACYPWGEINRGLSPTAPTALPMWCGRPSSTMRPAGGMVPSPNFRYCGIEPLYKGQNLPQPICIFCNKTKDFNLNLLGGHSGNVDFLLVVLVQTPFHLYLCAHTDSVSQGSGHELGQALYELALLAPLDSHNGRHLRPWSDSLPNLLGFEFRRTPLTAHWCSS